jgi:hypothetical protein
MPWSLLLFEYEGRYHKRAFWEHDVITGHCPRDQVKECQ